MPPRTYTQEEISSALNVLKTEESALLSERKGINQKIKEKRANIKYYQDLDSSQYKAF